MSCIDLKVMDEESCGERDFYVPSLEGVGHTYETIHKLQMLVITVDNCQGFMLFHYSERGLYRYIPGEETYYFRIAIDTLASS